jgi:hypothetical protein
LPRRERLDVAAVMMTTCRTIDGSGHDAREKQS